ncbi:MAG: hemerythrin domain-containing protein [Pseudomonadota bacterium]
MQRSPLLQPLSREHHQALKLARRCERAAATGDSEQIEHACVAALQAFAMELEPHFQVEEQELLPNLHTDAGMSLIQRTQADHRALRELCAGMQRCERAALAEFSTLLRSHVRFEERELFPFIEALLD